jgi:transposase
MSKKRTRYTEEFKAEAVKLVTERGYSQSEAAENLGINSNNLSRWILQSSQAVSDKDLNGAEQKELLELRRENKRLKMEREILKKAAAFFANEPT